jgi:hypothetical protein
MDTGVANILDDKYAASSAEWQQVSRPETAKFILHISGFGGLVVSMLASGTRVRGFFRAKKSSACLPSEAK